VAHERAAAKRAERERQRQDRERAAARVAYLDGLAGCVEELWERVETLVATKRPADYDKAVQVIRDLHDLAARRGRLDRFMPRLEQLRTRHAKKAGLLQRLASTRLTPEQVGASETGGGGREL
jgi:hypothetical protein